MGIFTLSFTPGVEHSLLFRRMEGQTENFTPGDNFTPKGQNSPLGDTFSPLGTTSPLGLKIAPGAKLRMGLCSMTV
jgi:hypothetical protein